MRRLLLLALAVSLVAAACSNDNPAVDGDTAENGDAQPGNGPGDGNGDSPGSSVSPSIAPPGAPTAVRFRIESRGAEPSDGFSDPLVLVARSGEEAEALAGRAPAQAAADFLKAWDAYQERALVAVFGGPQPDQGYRVRVRDVSITRNGTVLTVFGLIDQIEGSSGDAIAVPWAVVSLDAGAAALLSRCWLSLEGQTPTRSSCS